LKVDQARLNLYPKHDYDNRVNNIQHNFDYLMNIVDSEEYEDNLNLVLKVQGHEETIEVLLKVREKRIEAEEALKNNPPEEFINRIAKERIEIKKRNRERNLKLKQRLQADKEIQEDKEKELLEKQKQDRIQKLELWKEKRAQERIEYKTVSSPLSEPLYKKLEKKYERKVLMPDLEKKKELLKSIRTLRQPLDFEEIKSHARQYSQQRQDEIERKRKEREDQIKEYERTYEFNKHKSMFLNNLLENEREQQEQEKMKNMEKQDLIDKMKNYGQLVLQMHKPVVSRKKQIEVEINKAKLIQKPRMMPLYQSQSQGYRIGLTSPQNSERSTKDERAQSPVNSICKSEYRSLFSENKKLKPIKKWKVNELAIKPKKKIPSSVTDWLLQRRLEKQNEDDNLDTTKKKIKKPLEWSEIVKKMSQKEKLDFLLSKAKNLEEKAKMKDEHNKMLEKNIAVSEE